ncbi:MAG: hypothetical protein OXG36_03740 [Caldilineaceae bacterium]|nr:hypothetical protein [Caldilineaceae bacterium]
MPKITAHRPLRQACLDAHRSQCTIWASQVTRHGAVGKQFSKLLSRLEGCVRAAYDLPEPPVETDEDHRLARAAPLPKGKRLW